MIKFKPKILMPKSSASMCNLFLRGQSRERACCIIMIVQRVYKLCSDKSALHLSFLVDKIAAHVWQAQGQTLGDGLDLLMAWLGFLLCNIALSLTQITCKQWVALFAYRINHFLPCSWPLSKVPCRWWGAGFRKQARHTYWINMLHHLYKREERERKCNAFCITAAAASKSGRNGLSLGLTNFDNLCTLCKTYIHSTLWLAG
jgi:hypothetical protein